MCGPYVIQSQPTGMPAGKRPGFGRTIRKFSLFYNGAGWLSIGKRDELADMQFCYDLNSNQGFDDDDLGFRVQGLQFKV